MDLLILCRECGRYVNPATAEQLDGLCGHCAFGSRGSISDVTSEPRVKYAQTFEEPTESWPADDSKDPIRDAIDRAACDWANDDDNNQRRPKH
jgi:NMD protein affecting ribosome stability and mRNA decay